MKYETMRRIKRQVGEVRKVGDVCSRCGCRLTKHNRSPDTHSCEACFHVEMAEIEAEDLAEDSLTDSERLANFLG